MLKTIRVEQVRLGMHLHRLEGSWINHPFWKTRFVLTDPADLARLRASGVRACVIDSSKGLDVESEPAAATPAPPAPPAPEVAAPSTSTPPPERPAVLRPARRTSLEDEAVIAGKLCAQARRSVSSLHDQARMGRALVVDGCAELVDDIAASMERNASALLGLVRLKSHDDYTFMHSVAVCTLMVVLGRRMGLSEPQVRDAGLAGLLHDVGKAKIPLSVLNKPGKLSPEEYRLVQHHPRLGHDLLREAGVATPMALDVCLHHHETPDGKGYPESLSGAALSLHARMGSVCDVYDAITSNRPYKSGWGPADSIAKMAEWTRAGQFDPEVFRAFIDCVGIYPVGSLVRLRSERLAVVVEHNPAAPVAPRVKVFYSIRAQLTQPTELLDLSQPGCRDQIIGRESNAKWRFPFLESLVTPGAAAARPPLKEPA